MIYTMNNRNKYPTKSYANRLMGITLIEVLIAMVLGLLLLSGAISLFINNKRVFKENDQMGRLQESARFSIELLTKDIRSAGFIGCHHDINQVSDLIDTDNGFYNTFYAIRNGAISLVVEGLESGATAWQPSGELAIATGTNPTGRVADTDAIIVRYLSGEHWNVVADNDLDASTAQGFMVSTGDPLVISTVDDHPTTGDRANNLVRGEFVAVSDCSTTHLFQIGSRCASAKSVAVNPTCAAGADGLVSPAGTLITPGNSATDFGGIYGEDARVRRYIAVGYYIGNGGYGGPSLYRQIIRNNTVDIATGAPLITGPLLLVDRQELVEGVENMQILYGVDSDDNGTPNEYFSAVDVTDWGTVVSVRIALLIRSIDQNFTEDADTANYTLLGTTVDPADLRVRRRVFTTTIQIKNRINDGIG